jgi:hypothetical protein
VPPYEEPTDAAIAPDHVTAALMACGWQTLKDRRAATTIAPTLRRAIAGRCDARLYLRAEAVLVDGDLARVLYVLPGGQRLVAKLGGVS